QVDHFFRLTIYTESRLTGKSARFNWRTVAGTVGWIPERIGPGTTNANANQLMSITFTGRCKLRSMAKIGLMGVPWMAPSRPDIMGLETQARP
ncbi:MAG: hypothetical protein ACREAC_08680, partial [Blastocatellia bacterium]